MLHVMKTNNVMKNLKFKMLKIWINNQVFVNVNHAIT